MPLAIFDVDCDRLRAAYERVRDELLAERTPDGHWVGELSSSALSTATAVSALAIVRRVQGSGVRVQGEVADLNHLVARGVSWLVNQQNADGGFGDTDLSHSNIATTYLVVAALHLAGVADDHVELLARASAYIDAKGRLNGLRERYGIDKTFVVPIVTNLALAGLVDWREVDSLPFELACVPQSWYRFVGMPVVSYAIPALVAIGQARYFHAPPRNPIARLIRRLSVGRSLKVLRRMQPESGGYLEATPLTSFVVMSLASTSAFAERKQTLSRSESRQSDQIADEVIREGVRFLVNSVRPDGSWPIDTNLATWNTTLAINALAGAGENVAELLDPQCLDWLLSCQHLARHPFTGADRGGFGWSDLSGAVPDADDTPGAILALGSWPCTRSSTQADDIDQAIELASSWLMGLQNRDGGWPTFCRGWGKLPFDRSGADLTAHVIRVISMTTAVSSSATEWLPFIKSHQHPDGSWSPLWFGNQDHPDEDNPVYGTAKVLMAYRDLGLMDSPEAQRGVAWLLANQNEDGGWGSGVWGRLRIADCGLRIQHGEPEAAANIESLGEPVLSTQYSVLSTQYPGSNPGRPPSPSPQPPASSPVTSSIEETALAIEALLAACPSSPQSPAPSPASEAVARGLAWLLDRVEAGQHRQPAPIGFYFAKLWYYERLYPLTFTVAALGRACHQFARRPFCPPEQAQRVSAEPASDAP
jgi:squalene-hopene/tetraprenyl-beta-curcumene cyclase